MLSLVEVHWMWVSISLVDDYKIALSLNLTDGEKSWLIFETTSLSSQRVPRKRRRQLLFYDPVTQLPEEELQQQINNSLTQTRNPTLATPASHLMVSAAELLRNPCKGKTPGKNMK